MSLDGPVLGVFLVCTQWPLGQTPALLRPWLGIVEHGSMWSLWSPDTRTCLQSTCEGSCRDTDREREGVNRRQMDVLILFRGILSVLQSNVSDTSFWLKSWFNWSYDHSSFSSHHNISKVCSRPWSSKLIKIECLLAELYFPLLGVMLLASVLEFSFELFTGSFILSGAEMCEHSRLRRTLTFFSFLR